MADFLFETTVVEKQLTEITRTAQFAWTVTACLDPCSTLPSLLGLSNLPSTYPVRDSYSRLLAMISSGTFNSCIIFEFSLWVLISCSMFSLDLFQLGVLSR